MRKIVLRDLIYKILSIMIWVLFWEVMVRKVGNINILPSPITVVHTIGQFIGKYEFWKTIFYSSGRIMIGFFLAIAVGILFAFFSYRNKFLFELIKPIMLIMKAVPVASFIILALLWINKKNLSILISFIMVLPLIYTNVLQGLKCTDFKLLEMAKVFHIGKRKKLRYIYIPTIVPYIISAVSVGLGFSWKAGIAAEVIGIPKGTTRFITPKRLLILKTL